MNHYASRKFWKLYGELIEIEVNDLRNVAPEQRSTSLLFCPFTLTPIISLSSLLRLVSQQFRERHSNFVITETYSYPIGTPGVPWGDQEKEEWLGRQSIRRSYPEEVLKKLEPVSAAFEQIRYGALSIDADRYPLLAFKTGAWQPDRPNVLVTGGVHGYETSGVQGAIRFLVQKAESYAPWFNFVVAPCVSPWGYETINRWNPAALDPNRSFGANSPAEESAALMGLLNQLGVEFLAHLDLHETTDTDNTEFRPALAARDAEPQEIWQIPDGFYTVGDTEKPAPDFQRAIIASVEKVTHIAPPDDEGNIIGEPLQQWGVINYQASAWGLCMGVTGAPNVTTTEVYPDSPRVDDETCIQAQVAAVEGGLGYLRSV